MLGMDALRYFLLREVVFGQDGNFSYDALVTRYNSDLANGLGNLASRTAAMIEKNFAGKIPKPGELQPQDDALAKEAQNRHRRSPRALRQIRVRARSGSHLERDRRCRQISHHRTALGARTSPK